MSEGTLRAFVEEYLEQFGHLVATVPAERIETIGAILFDAYRQGRNVFVAGNGGSAATASHLACDLAKNTPGSAAPRLRITSLNDNVPLLTALANDLGYEHVFSEQLVNVVDAGDVLIVLSGSGRSPNILEAMRYARTRSATVVALLGFDGGEAAGLADVSLVVPSEDYGLIEDIHLALGHVLTGYFQRRLEVEERSVQRRS